MNISGEFEREANLLGIKFSNRNENWLKRYLSIKEEKKVSDRRY